MVRVAVDRLRAQRSPGLADATDTAALVDAVRGRADRLVVVAQPGAARALAAWGPLRDVRMHTSAAELSPAPGDAVIALLGPAWVAAQATAIEERGGTALIVAGDGGGEPGDPPSGGWWVEDRWAGDGRFGALGPASAFVAGFGGVEIGRALSAAARMEEACAGGLRESPAWSLALAAALAARDLERTASCHWVDDAALSGLAEWAVRCWGASGVAGGDGLRRRHGAVGAAGLVGDEEFMAEMLGCAGDHWGVLWQSGQDGAAELLAETWCAEGHPLARIRLSAEDAASRGAALALVRAVSACLTAWSGRPLDALPALAPWTAALNRAAVDAAAADE
jgi:hypothetical protein